VTLDFLSCVLKILQARDKSNMEDDHLPKEVTNRHGYVHEEGE
jgi:hypothetical protein